MAAEKNKSRRRFLLGGVGLAGALVVGWGFLPPRQRLHPSRPLPLQDGEVALNGWIKVAPDGAVSVVMHKSEMGQGIHTALQMLVAEELDVPLSAVHTVYAPIDKIYGNVAVLPDSLPFHPDDHGSVKRGARWMVAKLARELGLQFTGGSSSVKDSWGPMREAGAAARAMLVAVAAKEWGVSAAQCQTRDGAAYHADGRRLGYGALAARALQAGPQEFKLKDPSEFKLIGVAQPRVDAQTKVDGEARFGIDARPSGLLYAAVKMCPQFGGSLKKFDAQAVKSMRDVVQVVDCGQAGGSAAVAVIAKSYWSAKQALQALPIEWDAGPHAQLSSADIFKDFASALDKESGFTYYKTGELPQGAGLKTIHAEYRAPFLAHTTMEPINCTAQLQGGKLQLWVSTQAPSFAVQTAAKTASISQDDVTLHMCYVGGGFGRRLEVDMVAQATALAMQTRGAPVQLIWSREEDVAHDMYRPAALARFNAQLDGAGHVVGYESKSVSGSVSHHFLKRNMGLPPGGPDAKAAEGEFDMPYEFANQRIAHIIVDSAVPLGNWRSVGHAHNAFFKESFIDELAGAAGKDAVDFRRDLLKAHPRHLAVLNAAVDKAGQPAPGRAQGVALHESYGSIVAQVAEVSVADKEIRVHKVTCAIDCGIAVNPNIVAQQMESGIVYGLTAALLGEITIKDGKVEQSNFNDYPALRMSQAPEVETVIVKSALPPEGVGEPGTPPIAPAVANAVFKLTGQRLRSLPLRLS